MAYRLADGRAAKSTIASNAGYCVLRAAAPSGNAHRYILFLGKSGVANFKVLGGYDSAEEAKQAAEAHHAKSQEEIAVPG